MISVLVPSRGRPDRFGQMRESLYGTALGDPELVLVLDGDDPMKDHYPSDVHTVFVPPDSMKQSALWNVAWDNATGDFAMMGADDMLFKTLGWDSKVEKAFELWPDRIGMVYTAGGFEDRPEFPIVSRQWTDIVGYFTPPHFCSWFADRWLWEIAATIGRRQFVEDVQMRHLHPDHGDAEVDETYLKAKAMRLQQRPWITWARTTRERQEQAEKLAAACEGAYPWDERFFVTGRHG